MSDVQRFLTQLASSADSQEGGSTLFVLVGGMRVSGQLISRKGYIERMRAITPLLSEAERARFEAAFSQLESAPDLLDTLYLDHAHINGQVFGTWCVAVAAVDAAAVLVG